MEEDRPLPQIDIDILADIPIPFAPDEQRHIIDSRVDRILAAKKAEPSADTSALEAEIDQIVYQLYGLTDEEIAIVEASLKPEQN